ncbi:MAG: tRNA lysidine(34) synthetase TilS [Alphaproteobacteria bacterium PA4]|nr:MAG: tRNA lysidine(34) synthetase TilS [Alphaproteobacteria bacterium PA4]
MLDLAALTDAALGQTPGRALGPGDRLAIAVSGGPDSMALLWLAHRIWPDRVVALTVDHGLRGESAAEAAMVAQVCADAGIPHMILVWEGPKPAQGVPAAARHARYALLADRCAAQGVPWLLTAHHADDQAETLLMRLARGSGSAGLAGIRAARPLTDTVTLLRPLLAVRRAELAAVLAASGWPSVDDPSNRDPHYTRTHARALLAASDWLDVPAVAAAAAHLAEVEAALAWTADRAWAGRADCTADAILLDLAGLPPELARRLIRRALAALAPEITPRGPEIARLQARLAAGGTATLAGIKIESGPVWRFGLAPPSRQKG